LYAAVPGVRDIDDITSTIIGIEFADHDACSRMLTYSEQRGYRLVVELGCNQIVENTSP
jgi:hypothetical protein